MAAKKKSEPLNLDLIWAAIDDVINALEQGKYLRSDKESTDQGGSWSKSGYLPGLYAARQELERQNAELVSEESEPDA